MSELSDEILVSILSRLTLGEAVHVSNYVLLGPT